MRRFRFRGFYNLLRPQINEDIRAPDFVSARNWFKGELKRRERKNKNWPLKVNVEWLTIHEIAEDGAETLVYEPPSG